MKMKEKFGLDDLVVKSFVTKLNDHKKMDFRGGETEGELCNTNVTCNFKCGDTEYWECGDTNFCTNTCGPNTLCTQSYGHCCSQGC